MSYRRRNYARNWALRDYYARTRAEQEEERMQNDEARVEPVPADSGALMPIGETDPGAELAFLERRAALATRMREAMDTILIANTYPEDWSYQGTGKAERACLGSAGAGRLGRLFAIQFEGIEVERQEIDDAAGKGYRYIVSGYARRGGTRVYAEGVYSTRDKFLGFVNDAWRAPETMNENEFRDAARHIFIGNAVKELLGIRNIPAAQFREMMRKAGQDPTQSRSVDRSQGTQGGTGDQDRKHQSELAQICLVIANAGQELSRNEAGEFERGPISEGDDRTPVERAKAICIKLSEFVGRGGEVVKGLPASQLKGQRLDITLAAARKLVSGEEMKPKAPASEA